MRSGHRATSSSSRTPTRFSIAGAIRALVRNFASERGRLRQRRRRARRRPRAAGQVRGPLLPLRALDPARRVGHRLDDRRRRRALRDPARAVRAARRRHHPRRHGDSDGGRPGRAARRVRARGAGAGAGRRDRATRSSRARRAWSPARCSSWPGATARCRSSSPQVILSLVSHKALRWMSPAFAMVVFLSSVTLAGSGVFYRYTVVSIVQAVRPHPRPGGLRAGAAPAAARGLAHYFCLVQAAAAVGFVKGLSGRQSVLWRRFVRAHAGQSAGDAGTDGRRTPAEPAPDGARRARAAGKDGAAACRRLRGHSHAAAEPVPRHSALSRDLRAGGLRLRRPADLHHAGELRAARRLPVARLCDRPARRGRGPSRRRRGAAAATPSRSRSTTATPTTSQAARILAKYGATATFYITAGCLAGGQPFWPAEIRHLVAAVRAPRLQLEAGGRRARPAARIRARARGRGQGADQGVQVEPDSRARGAARSAAARWPAIRRCRASC